MTNEERDRLLADTPDKAGEWYRVDQIREGFGPDLAVIYFRMPLSQRPLNPGWKPIGMNTTVQTRYFEHLSDAIATASAVTPNFVLQGDAWQWPRELKLMDDCGAFTRQRLWEQIKRDEKQPMSNAQKQKLLSETADAEDEWYQVSQLRESPHTAIIHYRRWEQSAPRDFLYEGLPRRFFQRLDDAMTYVRSIGDNFILSGDEWLWPREYKVLHNLGCWYPDHLEDRIRNGTVLDLILRRGKCSVLFRDETLHYLAFEAEFAQGLNRFILLGGKEKPVRDAWSYRMQTYREALYGKRSR